MNEAIYQKIAQYLNGELTSEELQLFESELRVNEELSAALNMYKAIENEMTANTADAEKDAAVKRTLQQLNAVYFAKKEDEKPGESEISIEPAPVVPVQQDRFQTGTRQMDTQAKRGRVRTITSISMIVAAASVILFIGWFFLFNTPTVNQLADRYIRENLQTISPSLGADRDSIELGKAAFNKKDYTEAEKIFRDLSNKKDHDPEALEYLGIVYLVTGKYDAAVSQFGTLSKDSSLHDNSGAFYQAIALIKRNNTGDRQKATIILHQVADGDLPGHREALEWLKQLD